MVREITDWAPEDEKDYERARSQLKRRFARWRASAGLKPKNDAGEGLIHYKWTYVDGHLTRWARRDFYQIFLEIYPAKVIVDEDDLDKALEEGKMFVRFLEEDGLLDPESEPVDMMVDYLDSIKEEFRHNMADTSLYSSGKRMWTTANAEGVRLDDQDSVEAFMDRFNARPISERKAILGTGPMPTPPASGRFTPPGTPPRVSKHKRRKQRR